MSRVAHRLFSLRLSLNTAAHSSRPALTRRMMSSESHATHGSTSSDTQWIIGSALVFGPLFLYLASPSARKGSHGHTDHAHKSHRGEHDDRHAQRVESHSEGGVDPIADDEGTKVSAQEVRESTEKAFEADSPKDAQEREEVVAKAETTTVEENLAAEAHSQVEASTDATPVSESESSSAPSATVRVEEAPNTSSDEKTQSIVGNSEPAAESKA